MARIANLNEHQIRGRATPQSFAKGEAYYEEGAIFDPVQRDSHLEGFCQGSEPYPYKIAVDLDNDGIRSTSCTCPYDWGGDCKHIVALLLTYLNDPDIFQERSSLEDTLTGLNKKELVGLILMIVERLPALELLITNPDEFDQQGLLDAY
jgi:uncharacterized Zn finger protein